MLDKRSQVITSDDDDLPALDTRMARLRANFTAAFADHGIFRMFYRNMAEVAPGMYRSNQPSPRQLARAAREGIRTIVNLRGRSDGSYYHLERDACAELGLRLVNFHIYSRQAPPREVLHAARDLFASIEYPALMHCKSGADRAGLMSALFLLVHKEEPVETAMRQLSPRFGHYRQSRTGVLDYFLDSYRAHSDATGASFFQWVDEVYDAGAIQRAFHANRWATLLVDRILMRE